jgi:hypothetical protein
MTTTDAELERDLRALLHRRALDIPEVEPEVVPSLASRRARRPRRRAQALVGFAAAVAVAVPIAVVLVDDGDADGPTAEVGAATQEPVADGTILGADGTPLRAAAPLFVADGSPSDVALQYLNQRVTPELVRIDGTDLVADTALVRWSALDDGGVGTPGTVELHRVGGRWGVYASTSSSITVDVTMTGETLTGRVTTTDADLLCVDVVTPLGAPVPGSPFPEGNGGEALRGTAGCANSRVDVSLVVGLQPVVVRATLVGGSVLSISETRLDAPLSIGADLEVTTTLPALATTTTEVLVDPSVSTMATTTVQTIDTIVTATTALATPTTISHDSVRVQVFNGAGVAGIAGEMSAVLAELDYPVAEPDNAPGTQVETRVFARRGYDSACATLRDELVARFGLDRAAIEPIVNDDWPATDVGSLECLVVVGQDYVGNAIPTSTTIVVASG